MLGGNERLFYQENPDPNADFKAVAIDKKNDVWLKTTQAGLEHLEDWVRMCGLLKPQQQLEIRSQGAEDKEYILCIFSYRERPQAHFHYTAKKVMLRTNLIEFGFRRAVTDMIADLSAAVPRLTIQKLG